MKDTNQLFLIAVFSALISQNTSHFEQQYEMSVWHVIRSVKAVTFFKVVEMRVKYKMHFKLYKCRLMLFLGYFMVNSMEYTIHVLVTTGLSYRKVKLY